MNTSTKLRMVTAAGLLLLMVMAGVPGLAEDNVIPPGVHQRTATPADARYEIVQSQLAVKWTFKLDRYTGKVFQLAATEDGEAVWGEMLVWAPPELKSAKEPRFQIFTSGLSASNSFLIDTRTGDTWLLTERTLKSKEDGTPLDVRGWFPIKNQ